MENQSADDVVVVRKEEDIRAGIITEYGFDADSDAERIDKLVTKELDHDKKLSSAIGAKIKHRTEAEELKKKLPPENPAPVVDKKEGLSVDDVFALTSNEIKNKEDVTLAQAWAKANETTVGAILENENFKIALGIQQEKRKTAEVTNTDGSRRVVSKPSDDDLLKKAQAGELPESDEDIQRLMRAKMGGKK